MQVLVHRIVGRDHAGAPAGFNRHVAHGQPALDGQIANRRTGEFDDMAGGAGGTDFGDDRQHHILAGDLRAQRAIDDDLQRLRSFQPQTLRGENLFQL